MCIAQISFKTREPIWYQKQKATTNLIPKTIASKTHTSKTDCNKFKICCLLLSNLSASIETYNPILSISVIVNKQFTVIKLTAIPFPGDPYLKRYCNLVSDHLPQTSVHTLSKLQTRPLQLQILHCCLSRPLKPETPFPGNWKDYHFLCSRFDYRQGLTNVQTSSTFFPAVDLFSASLSVEYFHLKKNRLQ